MNLQMMKNPKVWIPAVLLLASLSTLPFWWGDSREDRHGREPHEVVILWENAYLQDNGAMMKQLAVSAFAEETARIAGISLEQGKQNNRTVPNNWVMEEYKVNDDQYLYHLRWVEDGMRHGDFLQVKRVNDEWKVDNIRPREFDLKTEGRTPRIIRGDDQ